MPIPRYEEWLDQNFAYALGTTVEVVREIKKLVKEEPQNENTN